MYDTNKDGTKSDSTDDTKNTKDATLLDEDEEIEDEN